MWTREELKYNAKQILKRTYWMAFVVGLLSAFIMGCGSMGSVVGDLQVQLGLSISPFIVMGLGMFGVVYTIFISNPIEVGVYNFFMTSREYDVSVGKIFSAFNSGYMNVVLTNLKRMVFIFLWSLLLFIPGIIKSYEYYFVPYIQAENPYLSSKRVFELSKAMTAGKKMDIFVLQLSFIGWILLGAILCGVGTVFVEPYVSATNAELYAAQRAYVLSNGLADEKELCGFEA